jgi:hypothetical protein
MRPSFEARKGAHLRITAVFAEQSARTAATFFPLAKSQSP